MIAVGLTGSGARRACHALAATLFVILGAPAVADTYIGSVQIDSAVSSGTTPGPASYSLGGGANSASLVMSAAAGGSIFAQVTALGDGNYGSAAQGQITYVIRLNGAAGADVPVTILANGYAEGSTPTGDYVYFASAGFTVRTDYNYRPFTVLANIDTNTNRGTGRQTFALNSVAMFTPNLDYYVTLTANAGASGYRNIPVTSAGFVDPSFIVDPAFASRYSFTGIPSDGTPPPVGGVPEPATWAFFVTGFSLIGGRLRRKRLLS